MEVPRAWLHEKRVAYHDAENRVRQYQQKLGYSGEWMAEYVYNIVILAKKEPKPKDVEEKDAKK